MMICIVGKSGSGKSTISNILKSYSDNIVILEGDKISHQTLQIEEVKNEIRKNIKDVFDELGNIDRKKLRKIVFNDKEKLDYINNLSWRYMEKMIDLYLLENKNKIVILDWLLAIKTKYFEMSDIKIFVDSPFDVRLKRVIERDNISYEDFIKREAAAPIIDKDRFDIVIDNIEINESKRKVEKIYDKSIIHRKF